MFDVDLAQSIASSSWFEAREGMLLCSPFNIDKVHRVSDVKEVFAEEYIPVLSDLATAFLLLDVAKPNEYHIRHENGYYEVEVDDPSTQDFMYAKERLLGEAIALTLLERV